MHLNKQHSSSSYCPKNHLAKIPKPILKHYRGYEPPAAAAGRLSAYLAAAAAHPAVKATMRHPAGRDYDEALIEVRGGAGWLGGYWVENGAAVCWLRDA